MKTVTEYCIYFPACDAYDDGHYIGRQPEHYLIVRGTQQRVAALRAGGRDLSDDPDAWRMCESQDRDYNGDFL